MFTVINMALYAVLGVAQPFLSNNTQTDCPVRSPQRWIQYSESAPPEHRVILRNLILSDGSIIWNRATISERRLITYLQYARRMSPAPYLVFQYEAGLPCIRINHFREIFEVHASCGRRGPCSERKLP